MHRVDSCASMKAGTDALNDLYTGSNIGWTTSTTGQASLNLDLGNVPAGDYAAFNNPGILFVGSGHEWHGTEIAPANSIAYYRTAHSEGDSIFDWTGSASTSLGYLNPGQTDPLRTSSDEIGSSGSTFTSANYAYGNRILATSDGVLVRFRQEVVLNATQDVTLYVAEKNGATWSTIFTRAFPAQTDGGYVFDSGIIELPIVSGRQYWFALHATGSVTFVREATSSAEYAAFGTWLGYGFTSGVPGIPSESGTTTALHQWIEVMAGGTTLPAIAITTAALPDGTNGTAYSAQLQATGGSGGYTWSLVSGSVPSGTSLSSFGLLAGTPTGTGLYSFTVRVTDAFGNTTTRALSVYVVGPTAVRFVTTFLPDGVVGQAYPDLHLEAEGGTAPYSFSIFSGALPAGLAIGPGSPPSWTLITGTPTTAAVYTFTLRVTDSAAHTSNRLFTVTVKPAGTPPYWIRRGLNGGELEDIAISPNWATDQTAYVTKAEGHRLFGTHDQGRTWQELNLGLGIAQGTWRGLAVSPTFNFNGANGVNKTVFGVYYSGTTSYVVRSTDGGASWTSYALPGYAYAFTHVLVISPNYATDGTLLVKFNLGFAVSTNYGVSWVQRAQNVDSLAFAPDGSLFASASTGADENYACMYSPDLGLTWNVRGLAWRGNYLEISPGFATDHTMFMFYDMLYHSTDGGYTWMDITRDLPTAVRNLVFQPQFDYATLAAQHLHHQRLGQEQYLSSSRWRQRLLPRELRNSG